MADATNAATKSARDLVQELTARDWQVRHSAHQALVAMGLSATPPLIEALRSGDEDVRWEAVRVLEQTRDPASKDALIQALEDDNPSVRWAAAQGLVGIGPSVLVPLLRRLLVHSESPWLQEGAHHVLRSMVSPEVTPVLKALEGRDVAIAVLPPVNQALASLEK